MNAFLYRHPRWAHYSRLLASASFIALLAVLIYRPILAVFGNPALAPWGSDTLGHLYRFEAIRQSVQQGVWYPKVFPQWYMGIELLRYYPPLPYYFMLALQALTGDGARTMQVFLLFWTAVGGVSFLLYRRWLGWPLAVLGGAVYLVLPDNVRVAFSEGNLPRVMANALLPLLVYVLIRSLEPDARRRHLVELAALFHAVTLCHPMMAAIFAVVCGLAAAAAWLVRVTALASAFWAVIGIALGIFSAGWWLLPSFSGGITELESGAVARGLDVISWTTLLNPLLRLRNIETVYVGLALMLLAVLAVVQIRRTSRFGAALAGVGLAGVLIVTPGVNELFNALPLSSLLWPVRFLGICSLLLLIAALWALKSLAERRRWLATALSILLLADCLISMRLIFLRPVTPAVTRFSQEMGQYAGWRQATLDESRLGSAPSYFFSAVGGREQIFGWAYQGARTAHNVASLNDAVAQRQTAYLLDRLNLYGVDDVVLLRSLRGAPESARALAAGGFAPLDEQDELAYFHRDGQPRGAVTQWQALAVGSVAQTYAYVFPQTAVGNSPRIDDYSLEELTRYPVLILSGFSWKNQARAEELVQAAAQRGVNVFVDLTHVPVDPLARLPHFLDVWGETVTMPPQSPVRVVGPDVYDLKPMGKPDELWNTFVPQGLETEVYTFDYLGKRAVAAGYHAVGQGRVWFLGLNLIYHTFLTGDEQATVLLGSLLGLQPHLTAQRPAVLLRDYQADDAGYRFGYHLDQTAEILLPVARLDGTVVRVDGIGPVTLLPVENLVSFEAPAGDHQVRVAYEATRVFQIGWAVSAAAVILLAVLGLRSGRKYV